MPQASTLVQSDMIGFVAFDLVLWIVRARVMDIAFVVHIPRVHAHDTAADSVGFGVPTHMIADFEYLRHPESPRTYATSAGRYCRSQHHEFGPGFSHFATGLTRYLFRIRASNMMCLREGNHSGQTLTILTRAVVKTSPA
jgi:hypothetical protein